MQLNFNSQQNNQNFCAFHSCYEVNEIIKCRIKNKTELKRLEQIITKAQDNDKADVSLYSIYDDDSITAHIYSKVSGILFYKVIDENIFTRLFGGGIVGFIKRCSKIADKAAVKIRLAEEIANSKVFDKMK